jgi:pyruvate formate lyase activating enzyme
MREASYYKAGDSGRVECTLCPHNCKIAPGKRGICGVRENQDGKLVSLVYGKLAASHIDPIEKKPLFHFLPGSSAYSVATVGCNLSCPFCQNHDLSLAYRDKSRIGGFDAQVEQIVAEALSSGCESLCFTYTEPTIFFEYMLDLAVLGKEKGLKNTMVSNGFIQPEPLKELSPYMDAANIDLKAFREKTYREILKARLQPVLDTISTLPSLGVWTEVTTLVVPGMNDSDKELKDIATFLAGLDPEIPWHVSRFYPSYLWTGHEPTPVASLRRALQIGKEAGLKYVYTGNVPGEPSESTACPGCGQLVIERWGFTVSQLRLEPGGRCSSCKTQIAGVFAGS